MQEVSEKEKEKRELIKLDIQKMFQKIALTAETEQQMKEAAKEFREYFLMYGICKPIIVNKTNNAKRQGKII